jgi:hypothetical protein
MKAILILHTCGVMLLADPKVCDSPVKIPSLTVTSCECVSRSELGEKLKLCIQCKAQTMGAPMRSEACNSVVAKMNQDSNNPKAETGLIGPALKFDKSAECKPAAE